ncbi:MAG: hypothetical protein JNL74_10095 [Fibrobacteres bacterium]|nr:hypothetical protein [Fibrobacterota bacterium]
MIDSFVTIGRAAAPESVPYLAPEELLSDMTRLGITEAYCSDYKALEYSAGEGNRLLRQNLKPFGRLHPVYVVLPGISDSSIPDNVKIVRAEPLRHGYSMAEWCSGDLWHFLESRRIPLLLDAGEQWDALHTMLTAHQELPVILTRVGYRCSRMLYPLLKIHKNLHFEISSFIVNEGVKEVSSLFGAERMIFGTDAPRTAPESAVGTLKYAGLTDEEYSLIAFKNIQQLTGGVK